MARLILEFQTQEEAQTCLDKINNMAVLWWQSQGYTVIDNNGIKELVGKNALTGQDEPNKARVITWDTVKESPDGTFYIQSLTNTRPEWENWKQNLADNFSFTAIGTEKEFPSSWIPESEF